MELREGLRNHYLQKAIDDGEIQIAGNKITYINAKGRVEQNYGAGDPEEYVRALVYCELIYKYGYQAIDMTIEETIPKVSNEFADIVVRYKGKDKVYAVVELKKEKANKSEINKAINDQYVYAMNLDAEFYVVDINKSEKRKVFSLYKSKTKELTERWGAKEREKNVIADLPEEYGEVQSYRYIKSDAEHELDRISDSELLKIFKRCHQILWDQGAKDPAEAFDEMSKFIFAKSNDELSTNDFEPYIFQIGNTEIEDKKAVAAKIRRKYKDLVTARPGVFKGEITADDSKIYKIVELLQGIDLKHSDIDAKGRAFEQFLDTVFKQKLGQYFTDRRLVVLIVNMIMALYPQNRLEMLKIIDPSCGSAGFLLHSLVYVRQYIYDNVKDSGDRYTREKEFNRNVFGIEKNEKIARVAMMDMIIFNDGHTTIECGDGLSDWRNYTVDGIRNGKGTFDIVLSNPPFGSKADDEENDQPYVSNYHLGGLDNKDRTKQSSDVLFLERNIDLLKPLHDGKDTKEPGHMAIIIPDGILNNSSFWYVRKYIEERCHILGVVSLPNFAFKKTGSGSKTSIFILKKFTNAELASWKKEYDQRVTRITDLKMKLMSEFSKKLIEFVETNNLDATLNDIYKKISDTYEKINELVTITIEESEVLSSNNDKEKFEEYSVEILQEDKSINELTLEIIDLFSDIKKEDKISRFESDEVQRFALLFRELETTVKSIENNMKNDEGKKVLKTSRFKGKTKKVYSEFELIEKDYAKDKTIINMLKVLGFDILGAFRREIRYLEIEKDKIDNYSIEYETHKEVLSYFNKPIFMASVDNIGYDASGRNTKNELFTMLEASKFADLNNEATLLGQWKLFLKDKDNFKGVK